ncbi:conserved exported hypothetical protein [Candidatus Methylobacter favarea]|uniref:DUF2845 domain-containing protein n=1 Tax=Candidatus Methylobacter favarea TaxID=2707345 RepID=A0A8S0WYU5_9GAMM|nr:DUF2845 domain-containing protein [Candidatus Methylobacter favarea]CAA9889773.1 conserved exported hypothetical protein [Candidatus Methylobacter favarea]
MKHVNLWISLLCLLFSGTASALRCGHSLVNVGDYKDEVYAKCGEPDSVALRTKIEGITLHHPNRTLDLQQYEEVQVEEWIYNFGSSRLRQYLRFENGQLIEIRDLGRGD